MIKITDKEFRELAQYIYTHYGIYLKKEKKMLVMGRLQNLLIKGGFSNFTDYFHYVFSDKSGKAERIMIDKITTNHTYFMRGPEHFYFFKEQVLPYLKRTVKDKDLRIWCAACSTGEESYTLAMLINEFFAHEKEEWDTKILATDISDKVLQSARKGIYTKENIESLPPQWKLNYFTKCDKQSYMIKDKIKNEVIYRKFNLMDEPFPFKRKFHTIFCRNVMIYFDQASKERVIDKLYQWLETGGYLFIGHSESLNKRNEKFKYIMPAVYRKVM